jgi:hypothetical protein
MYSVLLLQIILRVLEVNMCNFNLIAYLFLWRYILNCLFIITLNIQIAVTYLFNHACSDNTHILSYLLTTDSILYRQWKMIMPTSALRIPTEKKTNCISGMGILKLFIILCGSVEWGLNNKMKIASLNFKLCPE